MTSNNILDLSLVGHSSLLQLLPVGITHKLSIGQITYAYISPPLAYLTTGGVVVLSLLVLALLLLYFLPSFIARKKSNFWLIFLFNLFLGGTGIGWVVALIWALSNVTVSFSGQPAVEPIQPTDEIIPTPVNDAPPGNNTEFNHTPFVIGCLAIVILMVGYAAFRDSSYWQQHTQTSNTSSASDSSLSSRQAVKTLLVGHKSSHLRHPRQLLDCKVALQCTSPEQLIRLYGKHNIKRRKSYDRENNSEGYEYVIYPGTKDEAIFSITGDMYTIEIRTAGSHWKLPYGLYVGMPLEKLLAVNGHEFTFESFGRNYDGRVFSWDGGRLENAHIVTNLKADKQSSEYEHFSNLGENFTTSQEGINSLHITVGSITATKNEPEVID